MLTGKWFHLEVVDPVCDYIYKMKKIFNFNLLKDFLKQEAEKGLKIIVNGMNGGKVYSLGPKKHGYFYCF